MTRDLFVWIYLNAAAPVIAGKLSINTTGGWSSGSFCYTLEYLARENCQSIDPATLPLTSNKISISSLNGYPSAILDAAPDRWGRQVIDRLLGERSYPDGYLLLNDEGRLGNLAFSSLPSLVASLPIKAFTLSELAAAALAIEQDLPVDSELMRALNPGTGGARPKFTVKMDNALWIAKLESTADSKRISTPKLEHATMTLAKVCGIDSAETKLIKVADKDVCLVKRFDREITPSNAVIRYAAISARTVLYGTPNFDQFKISSYARLARALSEYDDRIKLFRRMVFNCCVRNTDDHELNHALVRRGDGLVFSLAPAFDIVPQLAKHNIHYHAMIIGNTAAGTIENILSGHRSFGLTFSEARIFSIKYRLILQTTGVMCFTNAVLMTESWDLLSIVF
jgi:serine/threonine-protein kinase HipA